MTTFLHGDVLTLMMTESHQPLLTSKNTGSLTMLSEALNNPFTKPSAPLTEEAILSQASQILESRFSRSHYLRSPGATRDYLRIFMANQPRELFGMVLLDNQHGVMDFQVLFQGTIDGASVYPREVVKAALDANAAAVILAHNHPSGCSDPSQSDKQMTQRITDALNMIDVRVLDHLIIGGTSICSFAEQGLI
jgi:DNA repair protein RadC